MFVRNNGAHSIYCSGKSCAPHIYFHLKEAINHVMLVANVGYLDFRDRVAPIVNGRSQLPDTMNAAVDMHIAFNRRRHYRGLCSYG